MPENEFRFEQDGGQFSPSCQSCPISRIPDSVWQRLGEKLLRPPFRKRHPVVFWGILLLLLVGVAFGLAHDSMNDDGLPLSGDKLALVTIKGTIQDISPTLGWLQKLERNPAVKGILLRVDSPGGGAAASQELYTALARVAKTRPMAVSMGAMATSGGLMVSMAGTRIFANASTATGSIGVRMDIPQLQGLAEKLGVGQETLTTGDYKAAGSPLRPLTPQARAHFEHVMRDIHEQFVDIVAQGRKLPRETVTALADGRVFTGREAFALGLVDELGGQAEAHAWLAGQTGVPLEQKLLSPRKKTPDWFERVFKSCLDMVMDARDSMLQQGGSSLFLYQL